MDIVLHSWNGLINGLMPLAMMLVRIWLLVVLGLGVWALDWLLNLRKA